ncbi:hypothetical protein NsoK4_03100 [Nitrosopumilus sp. K4]|uniref:hypothetical protein n=1 Tax=Nitrosopumilus sp. K4 TaxID=2795383 RepID=UPI001BA92ACA|nr:hypothetical protein [Nitrosopumilus sp. K4]QUC65255.1 hypothetical protein NsoK4_03100 [Nitrosopumilus sp. K4]
MKCLFTKRPPKSRRAVSQIMGSVVILGVVTSIGSVIMFNGMHEINAFTYDLTFHDKAKNEAFREDLIFEHVRFEPNTNDMTIHLANIGTINSVVESLSVVKIDTQEILVNWADTNASILIKDDISIPLSANLSVGNFTWNDAYYLDSEYKISLTTSKGNFFTTVASPFNT